MYCEEQKDRCLLPVNKNGANISNGNGSSHSTGTISLQPNESSQENNSSNFVHRFLEPNVGAAILGAIIALIGSFTLWNLQDVRYEQELVSRYIQSVQDLLLKEYHESGKLKDPKISAKHIEMFIKSRSGKTLRTVSRNKPRQKLIDFLREAEIGFSDKRSNADDKSTKEILKIYNIPYSFLLRDINLDHAILNKSDFAFAIFQDADFTETDLIETGLTQSNLRKTRFVNANLWGAYLQGADLTGSDLRYADFRKSPRLIWKFAWPLVEVYQGKRTELFKANLRGADLREAKLQGADLTAANLINAKLADDIDGKKVRPIAWNESNILTKLLKGETLFTFALYSSNNGTKFPENFDPKDYCMIPIEPNINIEKIGENCKDIGVTKNANEIYRKKPFKKTDLSQTNLENAVLSNVDFNQTNLKKTNLKGADLQGADLQGADLQGADLQGANLAEANFTSSQIKSTCNWEEAIYKAKYDKNRNFWEVIKPDNRQFIKDLKEDQLSDPQQPIDCSKWD